MEYQAKFVIISKLLRIIILDRELQGVLCGGEDHLTVYVQR